MADSEGGGGFPSWIFYIGILIGFNVISYVFDWGFIIY